MQEILLKRYAVSAIESLIGNEMQWVLILSLAANAYLVWNWRLTRKYLSDFSSALRERKHYIAKEGTWPMGMKKAFAEAHDEVNHTVERLEKLSQGAANEQGQIETTLAQLNEVVLILDKAGNILMSNAAARSLFGINSNPIEQKCTIQTHTRSGELLDFISHMQEGSESSHQSEINMLNEQGSPLWFEVSGIRIPHPALGSHDAPGDKPAYLFVLHDITRLKRLESIRREFVANVSHELRTPVTVIKGFSETLLNDHANLSNEARQRFLQKVHRNVDRLHRLLEDLLTLSRLESERAELNCQNVSLYDIGEEAKEQISSKLQPHQQIHTDMDPQMPIMLLDEVKILQVYNNLLDNALRYANGFKTINIRCKVLKESIRCDVEDDGPGLPEHALPHLFERFYRIDKGRSRESGGTGLGLSIVKHIILMHGGNIWAENRTPHGLRISFVLPIEVGQYSHDSP